MSPTDDRRSTPVRRTPLSRDFKAPTRVIKEVDPNVTRTKTPASSQGNEENIRKTLLTSERELSVKRPRVEYGEEHGEEYMNDEEDMEVVS
jgi:hypothetical protein